MRMIDLIGRRFERLFVLRRAENEDHDYGVKWECQCDCGAIVVVRTDCLRKGNTKSCGCLHRELTSKRSLKDITGNRYGKLLVLERVSPPKDRNNKKAWWRCKCDCGNEHIADGSLLRYGKIKSCGCSKQLNEGEAAFNALYYVYRTDYRRRREQLGIMTPERAVFTLTKDEVRELTQQNCFYCGREPSTIKKAGNGNYVYNGLDRIDNTKGYTMDNIVPCCSECNRYKGVNNQSDFISWLKRIANHWRPG